jgi:hypothetical protein
LSRTVLLEGEPKAYPATIWNCILRAGWNGRSPFRIQGFQGFAQARSSEVHEVLTIDSGRFTPKKQAAVS